MRVPSLRCARAMVGLSGAGRRTLSPRRRVVVDAENEESEEKKGRRKRRRVEGLAHWLAGTVRLLGQKVEKLEQMIGGGKTTFAWNPNAREFVPQADMQEGLRNYLEPPKEAGIQVMMEIEAIRSEEDAQKAYGDFVMETNSLIEEKTNRETKSVAKKAPLVELCLAGLLEESAGEYVHKKYKSEKYEGELYENDENEKYESANCESENGEKDGKYEGEKGEKSEKGDKAAREVEEQSAPDALRNAEEKLTGKDRLMSSVLRMRCGEQKSKRLEKRRSRPEHA